MENLMSTETIIDELLDKAVRLVVTAQMINGLFKEEETRLSRENDVSRLKTLHMNILKDLKHELRSELTFGSIYELDNDPVSGYSKVYTVQTNANQFIFPPTVKKPPLGTVLVGIGSKGVPEDITILNISKQAREKTESEDEIINSLKAKGKEILDIDTFSSLIRTLIKKTSVGEVTLPISAKMFIALST
jgi:hypothetical protein